MFKRRTVLLLLALLPTVNSNETPTPRMCAVCFEMVCANGVKIIYRAGSDKAVWPNANSPTGIQNCSMENLQPDAPCEMANGSLILQTKERLHFDGMDTRGVRRPFKSQNSPCADLNLPPSSTPSPVIKAPIHNTPTPAAPNNSGIIIGSVIGSVIFITIIIIIIYIRVLIWKRNSCGQGQDRDHHHGNNRMPFYDAEDHD